MKFYNNDLSAFSYKTIAKGAKYEVKYTHAKRKDYWECVVDYLLAKRTILSNNAKRKDIMALYNYVKAHGVHRSESGRYMS